MTKGPNGFGGAVQGVSVLELGSGWLSRTGNTRVNFSF